MSINQEQADLLIKRAQEWAYAEWSAGSVYGGDGDDSQKKLEDEKVDKARERFRNTVYRLQKGNK